MGLVNSGPLKETMQITNCTDLYTNNRIIVDAAGTTPYATIQDAITYAATLGGTQDVFIRPGSYTENLTLVGSCNLIAEDSNNTYIYGSHTLPSVNNYSFSNITIARLDVGDLFTEPGTTTGQITLHDCVITIVDGYIFNAPTSTYAIFITNCIDSSAANKIANCTVGVLTITGSTLGAGATAFTIGTILVAQGSEFDVPINIRANARFRQCYLNNDISVTAPATVIISDTTITDDNIPVFIDAGCSATLIDCKITSTTTPYVVTGTGSVDLINILYTDQHGIDPALIVSNDSFTQFCSIGLKSTYNGTMFATNGVVDAFVAPCFSAYLSAAATGFTGNNTYTFNTVVCDTVLKNVGSAYNASTGIFTAPLAGLYSFSTVASLYSSTVSIIFAQSQLEATPGTYVLDNISQSVAIGSSFLNGSLTIQLAAGDTVKLTALGFSATPNSVDLSAGLTTCFSGFLIHKG